MNNIIMDCFFDSQCICKDLHLKCFMRRHALELTDASCAARMKHAKLLLQKFPQYATDFVFFMDKKVFSVASPNSRQNKVSGRLRELLKKKLSVFFGAGTARYTLSSYGTVGDTDELRPITS